MPSNQVTTVLGFNHSVHNDVEIHTETDVSVESNKRNITDASTTDEGVCDIPSDRLKINAESTAAPKKKGSMGVHNMSSDWETVGVRTANSSFDVSRNGTSNCIRKR